MKLLFFALLVTSSLCASTVSSAESGTFWSFLPITRPVQPAVERADWVNNPIDAFILARLEGQNLEPAPAAQKRTLIRRVHYDLTGLPPSMEEVAAFVTDTRPDAYERLVDRLLASPRYGERWGRHWLDLVRFAETNSFEIDRDKPGAWRYRDYVIDAFNADKPYDAFVREQLAGDEMVSQTQQGLVATSYYRLGTWDFDPTDRLRAQFDDLDGIVTTTAQVFLALTINCARCHDHKVDPILQRDYYRFLAFFRGIEPYIRVERGGIRWDVVTRELDEPPDYDELERRRNGYASERRALEDLVIASLSPEEQAQAFADPEARTRLVETHQHHLTSVQQKFYKQTGKRLRELKAAKPTRPKATCVREVAGEVPLTHVLQRGNPRVHGEAVQPGFPGILGADDPSFRAAPTGVQSSMRRTALADWIVDDANPLTARVIVNRLWQHLLRRGIVATPNNYGKLGRRPTHPELLDWLASELIARHWSLKDLLRLILCSKTYRMSSQVPPEVVELDPDNLLFSRFTPRRLTAEEVRDSILWVGGSLNLTAGGPGFYTAIPQDVLLTQSRPGSGWGFSSSHERARRSVYIHLKRSLIDPVLQSFDFADVDASCPVRFVTTQPTQALDMLNSGFMQEQAAIFAHFASDAVPVELATQVAFVLSRVFQRTPNAKEVERGVRFAAELRDENQLSHEAALEAFCLVALNLNEFLYLD